MQSDHHKNTHFFFRLPFLISVLVIILATPIALLLVLNYLAFHQPVVPLPDATENIHLGLAGDKHINSDEMAAIDYDWGAGTPHIWGEDDAHVARIHKSFYYPFDRAGGYPNNTDFPLYYDVNWFLHNHPDWLVYRCDKTTLAYEFGNPNVPLDITNPQVLQFMLDTWIHPALDRGYDGIGFDNINLNNDHDRCGVWKTNRDGKRVWNDLYGASGTPGRQRYVTSVLQWAKYMYHDIHTYKAGATVEMNFSPHNGGVISEGSAFNELLLPYIDIGIDESGLTNNLAAPPMTTDAAWQLEADYAQKLTSQNKGQFFIMAYPESNIQRLTKEERQWALANYLLLKGAHSYIFLSGMPDYQGTSYGYLNIIPEYATKVGHAMGPMYRSQGVYMRDYSQGKTLVNPSSSRSFTVSLPPNTYKDLYGNVVHDTIILQPHSGVVLVLYLCSFDHGGGPCQSLLYVWIVVSASLQRRWWLLLEPPVCLLRDRTAGAFALPGSTHIVGSATADHFGCSTLSGQKVIISPHFLGFYHNAE